MSTKIEPATNATTYCEAILAKMPRRYNGRQIFWKDDVESTAKIAAALMSCADPRSAIFHLHTATGVGVQTFSHFIYGNDSSGAAWPDLRAALKRLGVDHLVTRVEARAKRIKADASPPTVIERLSALTDDGQAGISKNREAMAALADEAKKSGDQDGTIEAARKGLSIATASIASVKTSTLAVTNKGEVITATPPPSATTPTAMVAQGGDFAVKTNTTRCAIDTNTGDILVITTRRILYGSPEHRAKMIEMNTAKKG